MRCFDVCGKLCGTKTQKLGKKTMIAGQPVVTKWKLHTGWEGGGGGGGGGCWVQWGVGWGGDATLSSPYDVYLSPTTDRCFPLLQKTSCEL